MSLHFTKMHGLGNDFAVVDARTTPLDLDREAIRRMADRHVGIGFDQLLTVEPARDGASVACYGIWNADGDPVGQCGNGVRCVAAWLHRDGVLALGEDARLQSPSGPVTVRVVDAATVTVDMGEPLFAPARIPFDAEVEADTYEMDVDGDAITVGVVSMGNPHALMVVEDLHDARIERLGPAITAHARFAEGCNAGFAALRGRDAVDLRVHERGSGWTRACGTGACAAMAVLRRADRVDAHVAVRLPGGTLDIDWAGPGHSLGMTGPAAFVFEGEWPLKPAA
ncbi:MAG TPA: diaminopimelate epimerase [Oleiagrimonas sp.]|nr:diaminopimelate epimerase [Oleiagrimonas sp.]